MSWQISIVLQIAISAIMTTFTRKLALSVKNVFLGMGALSYVAIGICGWLYALAHGTNVATPSPTVWFYLAIEGLCIPVSWLIQYRLILYVGASNAAIITTLNAVGASLLGILFLNDTIDVPFVLGSALIVGSILMVLRIQPDITHHVKTSFTTKLLLAISGAAIYAVGMYAEKLAVNHIGSWHYMQYGWTMQAVGAVALLIIFGRSELPRLNTSSISKGLVLGFITSISGMLYIYTISKGSLSHTLMAGSCKTALVLVLAAIFLGERNAPRRRVTAFILAMGGLVLIV